jgi:hypothetical protein
MLPDNAEFERLARKWEAEEDRHMNAWIDAHIAPDSEDDDDENHD